jgi:hypothetical protein
MSVWQETCCSDAAFEIFHMTHNLNLESHASKADSTRSSGNENSVLLPTSATLPTLNEHFKTCISNSARYK